MGTHIAWWNWLNVFEMLCEAKLCIWLMMLNAIQHSRHENAMHPSSSVRLSLVFFHPHAHIWWNTFYTIGITKFTPPYVTARCVNEKITLAFYYTLTQICIHRARILFESGIALRPDGFAQYQWFSIGLRCDTYRKNALMCCMCAAINLCVARIWHSGAARFSFPLRNELEAQLSFHRKCDMCSASFIRSSSLTGWISHSEWRSHKNA